MFRTNLLSALAIILFTSCSNAQETTSFAVIELYTSEGCSSCPAAEQLMPELKKQYGERVHVLEYHVDYWNRLGWDDVYSKKEFSDRQRDYTRIFKSNTVFTPQAVINGKASVVASQKDAMEEALDKELSEDKKPVHIALKTTRYDDVVKVVFRSQLDTTEHLQMALVLRETATQVKAGENAGRVLHHNDVVIELKTLMYENGEVLFTIPPALWAQNCYIVAYTQNAEDMSITGIKSADIKS